MRSTFRLLIGVGFFFLTTLLAIGQSAVQRSLPTPPTFAYRCDLYDDVTTYFILANDEVVQGDGQGHFTLVGYKEPAPRGRTDISFIFTILQPPITYGVDRYDHIWQDKGMYREIVGNSARQR